MLVISFEIVQLLIYFHRAPPGLTVLVFSTWLLFRSMMASAEFPYADNEE